MCKMIRGGGHINKSLMKFATMQGVVKWPWPHHLHLPKKKCRWRGTRWEGHHLNPSYTKSQHITLVK
jgi:hypothetical protein